MINLQYSYYATLFGYASMHVRRANLHISITRVKCQSKFVESQCENAVPLSGRAYISSPYTFTFILQCLRNITGKQSRNSNVHEMKSAIVYNESHERRTSKKTELRKFGKISKETNYIPADFCQTTHQLAFVSLTVHVILRLAVGAFFQRN